MTDDLDVMGTPNCPVHLVPLEAVGDTPDGRDSRWECAETGCTWVQIA